MPMSTVHRPTPPTHKKKLKTWEVEMKPRKWHALRQHKRECSLERRALLAGKLLLQARPDGQLQVASAPPQQPPTPVPRTERPSTRPPTHPPPAVGWAGCSRGPALLHPPACACTQRRWGAPAGAHIWQAGGEGSRGRNGRQRKAAGVASGQGGEQCSGVGEELGCIPACLLNLPRVMPCHVRQEPTLSALTPPLNPSSPPGGDVGGVDRDHPLAACMLQHRHRSVGLQLRVSGRWQAGR